MPCPWDVLISSSSKQVTFVVDGGKVLLLQVQFVRQVMFCCPDVTTFYFVFQEVEKQKLMVAEISNEKTKYEDLLRHTKSTLERQVSGFSHTC